MLLKMSGRKSGGNGFEFALGDEMEKWWRSIFASATPEPLAKEHSLEWYAESVLRMRPGHPVFAAEGFS